MPIYGNLMRLKINELTLNWHKNVFTLFPQYLFVLKFQEEKIQNVFNSASKNCPSSVGTDAGGTSLFAPKCSLCLNILPEKNTSDKIILSHLMAMPVDDWISCILSWSPLCVSGGGEVSALAVDVIVIAPTMEYINKDLGSSAVEIYWPSSTCLRIVLN